MKSSPSLAKKRVGIGVYPTPTIESALKNKDKHFFSHFTSHEKAYCLRKRRAAESFAGRMASKLAFWDALEILKPESKYKAPEWRGIEIERKKPGPPNLRVKSSLLKKMKIPKNSRIFVSITHEREFAMAVVVIEACPVRDNQR